MDEKQKELAGAGIAAVVGFLVSLVLGIPVGYAALGALALLVAARWAIK